jgi:hypothetical protein
MFDSALVYELAALRPIAEPLLLQVKQNTSAYIEAKRLLSFLGWKAAPLSDSVSGVILVVLMILKLMLKIHNNGKKLLVKN